MKRNIIHLIIVTLLWVTPTAAEANHIAGMDLTLTNLSGDDYLIRLALYRDCAGMDAPATAAFVVTCTADSTLSFSITGVPMASGSGDQVSTVCGCGTWVTTCNGGTYFGLKEYIYETQVTLPPCNHWRISWSGSEANLDGLCCRFPSNAIVNPTGEHAYIELTLDNLNAPGASTPYFLRPPGGVFVDDRTICIQMGSIDPNGDSLSYSLATPMTNGFNGTVSWVAPYSATYPLPGMPPVSLDPITGNLCVTPSMPFLSIFKIQIQKWRRINNTPTLIGTLYRDGYVWAIHNNNQPPVLGGIDTTLTNGYDPNDTTFTIEVDLGDTLQFAIWGYDPDQPGTSLGKPDIFSISWNNGIPQGSFQPHHNSTDSAFAIFSWVPDSTDAGKTHSFVATIRDYACFLYERQSYTYYIHVTDLPVEVEQPAFANETWNISPVPFTSRLEVTLPGSFQEGQIVLFDMQGRKAYTTAVTQNSLLQTFTLHTSKLKPGVYLLQLENSDGRVWRQKVLKSF
jgi:hypothetical protein